MNCTLIEVLWFLARRWSFEKRRIDQKAQYVMMKCRNLENQIEEETDPERKQQLQAKSDQIYEELDEADLAFSDKWDRWFPAAVKWCAAHTAHGSRDIRDIAVAGFDLSALTEQKDLQSQLPALVDRLLKLPVADWEPTGWARFVWSLQPKTGESLQGGIADDETPLRAVTKVVEVEDNSERPILQEEQRLVYLSFDYARAKTQSQKLTARESYEFWKDPERGLDDADIPEHPDLVGFDPGNISTYSSQLSRARKHPLIDEACYGGAKKKEAGSSIVGPNEI